MWTTDWNNLLLFFVLVNFLRSLTICLPTRAWWFATVISRAAGAWMWTTRTPRWTTETTRLWMRMASWPSRWRRTSRRWSRTRRITSGPPTPSIKPTEQTTLKTSTDLAIEVVRIHMGSKIPATTTCGWAEGLWGSQWTRQASRSSSKICRWASTPRTITSRLRTPWTWLTRTN